MIVSLLALQLALTGQIGLMWDANTDGTTGYRIYWGTSPGQYTNHFDVLPTGRETTTVQVPLPGPGTYYLAATATGPNGQESGYSNEVVVTVTGFPFSPALAVSQ